MFKDRRIPVKPTELPKLNDMGFVVMKASGPGGTAHGGASDVVNVEAPDGRIEAVTRPFHVEVSSRATGRLRFEEPVRVTADGTELFVQGSNRTGHYDLGDIDSASVVKREINAPVLIGSVVAAIVVPLVFALTVIK
jgi:hypothetical protein